MERNIYEWYVVYTRQGMEVKVDRELQRRGIESYCPVNKMQNKWWSFKRSSDQPLFTSYVFVKLMEKDVAALKKINGVVNVLYWLGKPAVVKEHDIHMIRDFLTNHTHVSVEKTSVKGFNYVYGSSSNLSENLKLELPTLGYRVVAGKTQKVKVVSINTLKQPQAISAEQYSHAG